MTLQADGFAGCPASCLLHELGPFGKEASPGARELVVAKYIHTAPAAGLSGSRIAIPARGELERESEPPTQRDLHCLGVQGGVGGRMGRLGWLSARQRHVLGGPFLSVGWAGSLDDELPRGHVCPPFRL